MPDTKIGIEVGFKPIEIKGLDKIEDLIRLQSQAVKGTGVMSREFRRSTRISYSLYNATRSMVEGFRGIGKIITPTTFAFEDMGSAWEDVTEVFSERADDMGGAIADAIEEKIGPIMENLPDWVKDAGAVFSVGAGIAQPFVEVLGNFGAAVWGIHAGWLALKDILGIGEETAKVGADMMSMENITLSSLTTAKGGVRGFVDAHKADMATLGISLAGAAVNYTLFRDSLGESNAAMLAGSTAALSGITGMLVNQFAPGWGLAASIAVTAIGTIIGAIMSLGSAEEESNKQLKAAMDEKQAAITAHYATYYAAKVAESQMAIDAMRVEIQASEAGIGAFQRAQDAAYSALLAENEAMKLAGTYEPTEAQKKANASRKQMAEEIMSTLGTKDVKGRWVLGGEVRGTDAEAIVRSFGFMAGAKGILGKVQGKDIEEIYKLLQAGELGQVTAPKTTETYEQKKARLAAMGIDIATQTQAWKTEAGYQYGTAAEYQGYVASKETEGLVWDPYISGWTTPGWLQQHQENAAHAAEIDAEIRQNMANLYLMADAEAERLAANQAKSRKYQFELGHPGIQYPGDAAIAAAGGEAAWYSNYLAQNAQATVGGQVMGPGYGMGVPGGVATVQGPAQALGALAMGTTGLGAAGLVAIMSGQVAQGAALGVAIGNTLGAATIAATGTAAMIAAPVLLAAVAYEMLRPRTELDLALSARVNEILAQNLRPALEYGEGIAGYQHGGIVTETGLAFLHAGETVTPGGGGGITININGYNRDPKELAREISRLMEQERLRRGRP